MIDFEEHSIMMCAKKNQCATLSEGSKNVLLQVSSSEDDEENLPIDYSLLEVRRHSMSNRLHLKSESEEVKKAQAEWEQTRKNTDQLITKVTQQVNHLKSEISKRTEEEKKGLAMFEKSRAEEKELIENSQRKLRGILMSTAKNTQAVPILKKVRPSSFVERSDSRTNTNLDTINKLLSHSAADMATKAFDNISRELQLQRKAFDEQNALLRAEELDPSNKKPDFSDAVSFLQMFDMTKLPGFGGESDPLSPQSLLKWQKKFDATLRQARDLAHQGLSNDELKSLPSFIETSDLGQWPPASYVEAQENIRKGQKEVEMLDEQFKEGMVKLKQQNAKLVEEARRDLEKSHELKEEIDAHKLKSSGISLLQLGSKMLPFMQDGGQEALDKAAETLKKLDMDLQTKDPATIFTQTKSEVDRLLAEAQARAKAPLPEGLEKFVHRDENGYVLK